MAPALDNGPAVFFKDRATSCIRVGIKGDKVLFVVWGKTTGLQALPQERFKKLYVPPEALKMPPYPVHLAAARYIESAPALTDEARARLREVIQQYNGAASQLDLFPSTTNERHATMNTETATNGSSRTVWPAMAGGKAGKDAAKAKRPGQGTPAPARAAKAAKGVKAAPKTGPSKAQNRSAGKRNGAGASAAPAKAAKTPKTKPVVQRNKGTAAGAGAGRTSPHAGKKIVALVKKGEDIGAREGTAKHALRSAVLACKSAEEAIGKEIKHAGNIIAITGTNLTNMIKDKIIKLV